MVERMKVRGDAVRVEDVLVLDGREYEVRMVMDIEGRGKVTGVSLSLRDNANGSRRSHNVGLAGLVTVYRHPTCRHLHTRPYSSDDRRPFCVSCLTVIGATR